MSKENKIPTEELRIVYGEIIRGCSHFESDIYGDIVIKHLTGYDTELLDIKKEKYRKKAEKRGLPTEEQRLKDLTEEGLWGKKKDLAIEASRDFISKMTDTRAKMALKSEIRRVTEQIEKEEKKLYGLEEEKKDLVGMTCESYSNKKVNDYYVFISLFKDREFKEPLFSEKEFDEVSEKDLMALIIHFNKVTKKFSQINLKRIAISHFFLNNFYLCKDNPFTFYGRPVVDLTYNQADLFSFGRYFKHVLSEMKGPVTEEMMDNPEKLIEQHNIEQNKDSVLKDGEKSGTASTVVGATKEDLEALGVSTTDNSQDTIDLNKAVAEKGGSMSMDELIKLHGA